MLIKRTKKIRFNQLLNKFSQNNVNAAAAGQTMKKNTKPPVSNKTHEPLDNNQNYIVKMATPKKQINVNNKNTSNLNKRSSNPSEKMLQGSEEARKDNKGIRRGLLLYSKAVEQQKMKL